MPIYTEAEKTQDFDYFKSINSDYFSEHGHKFLAIKDKSILDNADTISELIEKMNKKNMELGTYLLQECKGDSSSFTTTVMKFLING